jgi:2-phosphosulfolactate phosphatase
MASYYSRPSESRQEPVLTALRRLNVFFSPPPPTLVEDRSLVVIDALRATTTLVTLIAAGAQAVFPTPTDDDARALAAELSAGDGGGDPTPGFDFGNSPTEFLAMDVRDMTFVQSTSNGTRALELTRYALSTLVACLRNRAAVVQQLIDAPTDIAVVCAGEQQASAPSVEDAFTAGALLQPLLDAYPPDQLFLESGARLALRIFDAYGRDPARAIADAPHADYLAAIGYQDDLGFSIELDAESVVPRASVDDQGRVVVQR